jgi:hypothetical protein
MAGLVPAIHALKPARPKDVDAGHKAGHDAEIFRFKFQTASIVLATQFCARGMVSFPRRSKGDGAPKGAQIDPRLARRGRALRNALALRRSIAAF